MSPDAGAGIIRVSVCVATRNRGARIAPLLESLRRLDHDSFEVVIVDQSTDDATRQAYLASVDADPRFSYTATHTVGKSVACNIAVARARGIILAFTDDDCVARSDWLDGIERAFAKDPEVGGIFGGVVAAEYDPRLGHIPVFMPDRARLYRSRWMFHRARTWRFGPGRCTTWAVSMRQSAPEPPSGQATTTTSRIGSFGPNMTCSCSQGRPSSTPDSEPMAPRCGR
jgi:glycosyltransferase involved in cell wall biosynthesis